MKILKSSTHLHNLAAVIIRLHGPNALGNMCTHPTQHDEQQCSWCNVENYLSNATVSRTGCSCYIFSVQFCTASCITLDEFILLVTRKYRKQRVRRPCHYAAQGDTGKADAATAYVVLPSCTISACLECYRKKAVIMKLHRVVPTHSSTFCISTHRA